MTHSRMLFRLFKSIIELKNIFDLITKKTNDEFDRLISILNRFTYLLYWGYDNITILEIVKILKIDAAIYARKAKGFRLLGAFISILLQMRHWLHAHHKEIMIRIKLTKCQSELENQELALDISKIKSRKNWIWLELFKSLMDLIVNIKYSELAFRTFGEKIPDFFIGIAGLFSALIASARLISMT